MSKVRYLTILLPLLAALVWLGCTPKEPEEKPAAQAQAAQEQGEGVNWEAFDFALLEESAAKGQPVVIMVYADWCGYCQALDEFSRSDPRAEETFAPFRTLRLDSTNGLPDKEKNFVVNLGVQGLPTLIFFDGQGKNMEEAMLVGYGGPEHIMIGMEKARSLLK